LGDAKHEGIDIGHPNYGSDGVEASGAEMVGRAGRRDGDRNEQNREQSCGREFEWVARYYSPRCLRRRTSGIPVMQAREREPQKR